MSKGTGRYLSLALSHGFSLAITIYLAVLGGNWLDERLGTEPIFMGLGVVLMVIVNFRILLKDVAQETRKDEGAKQDQDPDE